MTGVKNADFQIQQCVRITQHLERPLAAVMESADTNDRMFWLWWPVWY